MKRKVIKRFYWNGRQYEIGDTIDVNREQDKRFTKASLIKKGVPKSAKDKMVRGGETK